jgi:hypothetical protein
MKLSEYFKAYNIDLYDFAYNKCRYIQDGVERHLCVDTIYKCMRGRRPYQRNAEIIEKATNGLVTVEELRGKDDRKKRPRGRPRKDFDSSTSI